MYLLGSMVEPTSVAYNAVIERGGGIRPGDNVVICGTGPIGLAAASILKRAGGARVIVSEPHAERAALARTLGADVTIDPTKEDFVSRVLEETDQMGATLYLEATGLPSIVWPEIEKTIWYARGINATVVVVARADAKMPVTGEVLQVRRAKIVGAQGHSGHGTFPRVISLMASGMDVSPMSTKGISLDEVPQNVICLQSDLTDCKITYVAGNS
jgi:threonine dehydrogenase-like Zn-dependent dehydrogenase